MPSIGEALAALALISSVAPRNIFGMAGDGGK